MLAIHATQWLRGNWAATKSFPTTCLLGVVAKNDGICWNRIILFISLFSSPSKLQIWKHWVLCRKTLFFFHILRFCRFLSFKVCMYIYIYLHIHIHYTAICIYVYYKCIYLQIPICIYFNYIYNTVHSYLGNWVLHKYSMCSFSKLPNHAAISIGRCTHIVFTHSKHTYVYICIYIYTYAYTSLITTL